MRSLPSGWNKTLAALGFRRVKRKAKQKRESFGRKPRIEGLEPRQMLSITVDTLVDEFNGAGVGAGTSLREAIDAVTAGNNVIDFHSSLDGGAIELELGQLTISENMTINGPGWDELTIDANGDSRIFHVTSSATATMSGLSLTGGSVDDSLGQNDNAGGAIRNNGVLTLDAVNIYGNTTDYDDVSGQNNGGGVYSNK